VTRSWFSPFQLPEAIVRQLEERGWLPWNGQSEPPEGLVLVYLPPHAALQDPQELFAHYGRLKGMTGLGVLQRAEHLLANDAAAAPPLLVAPRPLEALVTLTILREQPAILDAYLNLELQADLGNQPPDTDYIPWLREHCRISPLIQELDNTAIRQRASQLRQDFHQQQLQRLEQELSESRRENHQSLERLQGLDQHCRQLTLAAEEGVRTAQQLQDENRRLSSESDGLQADNRQLLEKLHRLEISQRQSRQGEAEARARCQSLEDELERLDQDLARLENSHQAEGALLEAQQQQINRATQLLQQLTARGGLESASGQPAIQVLALLEGYRHSLKRAERLLLGKGG